MWTSTFEFTHLGNKLPKIKGLHISLLEIEIIKIFYAYSQVPNRRAGTLIKFLEKIHRDMLIPGTPFILNLNIFSHTPKRPPFSEKISSFTLDSLSYSRNPHAKLPPQKGTSKIQPTPIIVYYDFSHPPLLFQQPYLFRTQEYLLWFLWPLLLEQNVSILGSLIVLQFHQ